MATAITNYSLGFVYDDRTSETNPLRPVRPTPVTAAPTLKPYLGAPYRSTDITDLKTAAKVYLQVPSAQVMLAFFLIGLVIRLVLGSMGFGWWVFGWHDAAALAFVAASTGPFEWFVHKFVLHAPVDSFRSRVLNTSTAHRRHHVDPTVLDNVVLGPEHAAQYSTQLALFATMWAAPMALLAGWPVLATVATGSLASWLAMAHYEWVHLAVHTRHRFKNRFYARLQSNHRWHHYRNENFWLGVTTNSGDRLLGTLPDSKSDVPLSETARSLA